MKMTTTQPLIEALLSAVKIREIIPEHYYKIRQQQMLHNANIEISEKGPDSQYYYDMLTNVLTENNRLALYLPKATIKSAPKLFQARFGKTFEFYNGFALDFYHLGNNTPCTDTNNIEKNFLDNIEGLKIPNHDASDILLIGGNRVKGHGEDEIEYYTITNNGDLIDSNKDVLANVFIFNPDYAHIFFNTIWHGDKKFICETQKAILGQVCRESKDSSRRAIALKKIERDLLGYNLTDEQKVRIFIRYVYIPYL